MSNCSFAGLELKIINKIAFLVHEPVLFAHYSSVWAEMDRDSFVIVLLGSFVGDGKDAPAGVKDFLIKIRTLGYEFTYLDSLVAKAVKYQYVVSNHKMSGKSRYPATPLQSLGHKARNAIKLAANAVNRMLGIPKQYQLHHLDPVQYLPLQAGIKQIRFMYGADISDGWSLDAWNEIYDLFLCHGPNDELQFKKRFKGKTAIMGYPRYDSYFSPNLNIDEIVAEFGVDRAKKTILWMPTADLFGDNVCSIPYFAKALSSLMRDFNIIVRPHPISFSKDPAGIELLESLGFKIDRDSMRDMNGLFLLADAILCDHGGSAFGALYLGKKLLFLKTPGSDSAAVAKESSNLELLKYFPLVEAADIGNLGALLNNASYWKERLELARALSDRYFADYRGNSSRKAADILGRLDAILSQP